MSAIIEEEKLTQRKKALIERKKAAQKQTSEKKNGKQNYCVLNIFQLHYHLTVIMDHVGLTNQEPQRQTSATKALKGRFNFV